MRRKPRKPYHVRFTVASRLLARTQALRADEAVTAMTLSLGYAAKWAQATEVSRGR